MQTVLYVSATGRIGGAERSLLELVRALDRSRFRPCAVLPDGPLAAALSAEHVQTLAMPAVLFRRTLCPWRLLRMAAGWLRATRATLGAIRTTGADLVHSNNTAAHLIGAPAAAWARRPAVWHVRDMHRPTPAHSLLSPLTATAVFVSDAVERALPVRVAERLIVPNAINADAFLRGARPGALRRELGLSPNAPLILMAAQMVPWKDHPTLLRALATLRGGGVRATVAIAGGDLYGRDSEYERSVRALSGELGLRDAVFFLGPREDAATLIADCDVVAIPSRCEPFGRVALEAMAVGRAVVGTAAGGLPEVVEEGRTGLFVPPGDPKALAHALGRLLGDPALRQALAQAGYERVRQRFPAAVHARRIESLYDRLTAPRGRR